MIVLICVTLLFSVRCYSADTGASEWGIKSCHSLYDDYCITVTEGEITAEAGLCVVIPCSFTTNYYFTPQDIIWYKCEPEHSKCSESDIIFDTDGNEVQAVFKGRVSLLEPDVRKKNCSIVINDLRVSDSGSYQLRVSRVTQWRKDGFTFSKKATVNVGGLSQKPTVTVPPLTERHQTTLTCTAPGLCSGSAPEITWTWSKTGKNKGITGNVTTLKTETLTAATQRHSSTLTFNTSAKHHNTEVTCQVRFTGEITTEETVTLNVTYLRKAEVTENITVNEGETLNLTCTVDSFPPSFVTWIKHPDSDVLNGTNFDLENDTLDGRQNISQSFLQKEPGRDTFLIPNVTAEDSGQYICKVQHVTKTVKKKVNVKVTYLRSPVITGNTTAVEGDALNLTCSVESFPAPVILWTKFDFNVTLPSKTDTGSATLFIPEVTKEQSGRYICTVKHLNTNFSVYADVTVTWLPKILNSRCQLQADVLTCVCTSVSKYSSPTIRWPLLENRTEFRVITTVSDHTVNSTVTLTVKDHDNTSVECVASNENGEVKQNISIQRNHISEGNNKMFSKIVSWLENIIAFLIGFLFAAVICSLTKKCHRKKLKRSGNLDETYQMVSNHDDPLIYDGPALEENQIHLQDEVEVGAGKEEEATAEVPTGLKDVEYASIDFSRLKRRSPREAAKRESTNTEYAEIKKDVKEERKDNVKAEREMLGDKEEEAKIEETEETQCCAPKEEEEGDMAVYSNVKTIINEV